MEGELKPLPPMLPPGSTSVLRKALRRSDARGIGVVELRSLFDDADFVRFLEVPDLVTIEVKPDQAPALTAEQKHWVIARDSCAAAITYMPEAGAAVPKLYRVLPREVTPCDPMSNEIPNDIRNHVTAALHIRERRLNRHFV